MGAGINGITGSPGQNNFIQQVSDNKKCFFLVNNSIKYFLRSCLQYDLTSGTLKQKYIIFIMQLSYN